jgi:pimeloyl-ACP methyl ester carboxylesterase
MVRSSMLTSLLLCLVVSFGAVSDTFAKEIDVNGTDLTYVEQGSGETIVFIHGAVSDHRSWDLTKEEIAKKYRFIAYSQRYFGTGAWTDDGSKFSVVTHADDLAKFIASLNAGPVHLVGWSYGGQVALTAAVKDPALVRSLVLYEASVLSVLPPDTDEGKAAREDRGKLFGPAAAANKTGDSLKATRLLLEAVFRLPPGGLDREPQAWRAVWDENARTVPIMFAAPPPPAITCDMLKGFARPTLIIEGARTATSFVLINDALSKCIAGFSGSCFPT